MNEYHYSGEKAFHAVIEPGDGTKYRITFFSVRQGWFWVAGLPDISMYEYSYGELMDCYTEISGQIYDEWKGNGYIKYIVAHSRCNEWSARAIVIATMRAVIHGVTK
jgi:hypothetical protein